MTKPDEIAAARSKVPQPEGGRIATNTRLFEIYGLNLLLDQANNTIQKWSLDVRAPLTVRDVKFWLKPKADCIQGTISTGRFAWSFDEGWMNLFTDDEASPRVYYRKGPEALRKLMQAKSLITQEQAVRMARGYLHALGLTEVQLKLREPPRVANSEVTTDDGARQRSPLFEVGWSVEGADPEVQLVTVTVSGAISNIVGYCNANPNTPRIPLPTNYFPMLNLPEDYVEKPGPAER